MTKEKRKVWREKNYQKNKAKILARNAEWRRNNPDKVRQANKKARENWKAKHPTISKRLAEIRKAWTKLNWKKVKEAQSRYKQRHPDANRDAHLRRVYGISLEQYNELLQKQNGVCALCCEPETVKQSGKRPNSLAVDHCHETSKIRGLLCKRCNTSVEVFVGHPERIERLVNYFDSVCGK